jgi:hypothetical protein
MNLSQNLRKGKSWSGGRRGIRTPGTVTGSAVFKTAAFDHSAILPETIYISELLDIFKNQ